MAIGNFFDRAGRNVMSLGEGVSGVGHWAQRQVSGGVGWVTRNTDELLDTFERSPVGDNLIGRNLSAGLRTGVHFTGGVVEGGAGLATGVVGAAGLAVQGTGAGLRYASDGEFREQANTAVAQTTERLVDGTIARNLGNQISQAWERDPANLVGQAVGIVGGTILTAGTGTAARATGAAADVAEAAAVGGRVARVAEAGEAGAARTAAALPETPAVAPRSTAPVENPAAAPRPSVETPNARVVPPLPPASPAGLRVADHLEEAGRLGKPTKGIYAAHRPAEFERLLQQGNGQVVERLRPGSLQGVENVQYRLARGDGSGEMGRVMGKTLFDEATWPRERLGQLSDRLFSQTPARQGEAYVRVGDDFFYTVRNELGEPRTFGVEDAASVARRLENYARQGVPAPNIYQAPADLLAPFARP